MIISVNSVLQKLSEGKESWNNWMLKLGKEIPTIKCYANKPLRHQQIRSLALTIATLPIVKLENKTLEGYSFCKLKINKSEFKNVIFENCDFSSSNLNKSIFTHCKFIRCQFKSVSLIECKLNFSQFNGCIFVNTNLSKSEQYSTAYRNCKIINSTMMWAKLIETTFIDSIISNSKIYGAAVWGISLHNTHTNDLIISKNSEAEIKVDNIEVAQFIYLLLNNKKIRDIITTLTSKIILILGRFTPDRVIILEKIKSEISNKGFVPILFTFEPSPNRDLTETIQLLASISKIVIADISEPRSVPQELSHIIPFFPSLQIQPIIFEKDFEYGMFDHWKSYKWVKEVFQYKNDTHLINNLERLISENNQN